MALKRYLLLGVVLAVVLVAALSWLTGGELMAAVPRPVGAAPAVLAAQSVMIPSRSGTVIHGWFSRGTARQGAVVLLHGVRGDRRDMLSNAAFLHRLGYAVLLIDFQAHGESPGRHITFGELESRDAAAAIEFVHRELPSEHVGVIGESLGAASVVLARPRAHVDALILESMYPSLAQALRDRLRLYLGPLGPLLAPLLSAQLQPRLGFGVDALRPIDRIGSVDAPVFIMSGSADRHTPLAEARALFDAAAAPKLFWAVEGAGHVSLHDFAPAEYERRVAGFLGSYLPSPAQ